MREHKRQSGMSIPGMLIIAAMVGFFIMCVIRLGPRYLEYLSIREIVSTIAREYNPDSEATALGRAALLLSMGKLEESIKAYRYALYRWPESPTSLNALGYTLADYTEEYEEAEDLIRKALEYDPDNPAIIDSLGWVLHKRGKNREALKQLEIAYSRFPDPEVAAHIIDVLSELDRDEEALEFLLAAEARDPESELLQSVRERQFPETE